MTVPAPFVGAWERRSIALDGGPATEPASVIWVQGRSAYADLRLPIDAAGEVACFAGHTTWDGTHLHWSHDLDLNGGPAAATDIGAIGWHASDVMVETGTFEIEGRDVPYVELWHRLRGSDGRVVETTEPGMTCVEVGLHSLCIVDDRMRGGGFTAEYRRDGAVVLTYASTVEAKAV